MQLTNTLLALTMREAPWEARYRQIANHVTAIGTEQAELQAALRAQVKAGKPVKAVPASAPQVPPKSPAAGKSG